LTNQFDDSAAISWFRLEPVEQTLSFRDQRLRLRKKSHAFLGRLVLCRLLDRESDGWVTAQEVAQLPEWSGQRISTSLDAQIRREIKALVGLGVDLVETPPGKLLKGPFRLKIFPARNVSDIDSLVSRFGHRAASTSKTAPGLFQWLEDAEPVWRAAHTFDKPGEALSNSTDAEFASNRVDPIVETQASISRARRLRELGDYPGADAAIARAREAGARESRLDIRAHLVATCHLHEGWLRYREKRLKDAEHAVAVGLATIDGHAHLRVRGQLLTLRSLLYRSHRQYDEALADLWAASRLFFVEVDLHNLLSVYHNLSVLLSERASEEAHGDARRALLLLAIQCGKRSDDYCRQYHVGQNSVISKLQLASLYSKLDDGVHATRYAHEAFALSIENGNRPESVMAYNHLARLLQAKGQFAEAERLLALLLESLGNDPVRAEVERRYLAPGQHAAEMQARPPGQGSSLAGTSATSHRAGERRPAQTSPSRGRQ
jgi:tetratricopeptide (TPR) repeat protein